VLASASRVDADVLVFERIARSWTRADGERLSVDEGFRHAMRRHLSTRAHTSLTAAVLYQYGTAGARLRRDADRRHRRSLFTACS
jgi:preprotein translocase subunit SecD